MNISAVQEILNLPSSIFNNVKITKMQDWLPIRLFTTENFITLDYAEMYTECAYFLPFTLLLTSLSSKDISIDERIDFLEISANYLQMYNGIYASTNIKERGLQTGKSECTLFNQVIINDLLTTLLTINSFLNNFKCLISLNRFGTNPHEHHFGLLRIRCKFDHSYQKFVKEATKVKVLHEIESETISNLN